MNNSKTCSLCQSLKIGRLGIIHDTNNEIVPPESLNEEQKAELYIWECPACLKRPRGISSEHTFAIPPEATCQQIFEDLVWWVSYQPEGWGFIVNPDGTVVNFNGKTYSLIIQEDVLGRMGFMAQLTAIFTEAGYINYVGSADGVDCLSFYPRKFDEKSTTGNLNSDRLRLVQ